MSDPFRKLTVEEATERGRELAKFFELKEARDQYGDRYDPPRYDTAWGIKTHLGLFLSVENIIKGEKV